MSYPFPLDTGGFGVLAAVVRELVRTLKCIIRTKSKEHELHDGALGDPWSSLLSSNDENQNTARAWHPDKVCEVCSLDLNSAIPTLDIAIICQKVKLGSSFSFVTMAQHDLSRIT
jgi:hypothetical protein